MAKKSGIFKVWLVGIARSRNFQYDCYGKEVMQQIGTRLQTLFNDVCKENNSTFASASFTWEKGAPNPTDVVAYVLFSPDDSIIYEKGGQAIHQSASGGTYRHGEGMISEVYLQKLDGAPDFVKVSANIIFHELMHNKLDASVPQSITDIHTKGGAGLAQREVKAGTTLTDKNKSIMAGALSKQVTQYKGKMRKPRS